MESNQNNTLPEEQKVKKIPDLSGFVCRLVLSAFLIFAGLYDALMTCRCLDDFGFALIYTIPMLAGGMIALVYSLFCYDKEKDDIRTSFLFLVSLMDTILFGLYLVSVCFTHEWMIAIYFAWPIGIFYVAGLILMIVDFILHRITGNHRSVLVYGSLALTLVGSLVFAVMISYQSFYIFGGILFALADVALFFESVLR